jgi:ADP-heptose:LPS heptosyltransferase
MNVDLMRKIDYYAGVPLCFLTSLLLKLFPRPKPCRPNRVLLVELSEMGSAILVDPAMQKLKRELDAELFFVIFEKNKPSLQLLNTVADENIFTIRADGLFGLGFDTLRFLFWTRRQGIDTVIDLELFSRYTALLTGLSGAANRVGFHAFYNEGLYRGNMLSHRVAYNPHIHIARNFIALVNALMADGPQIPYSKTLVTDEEIRLGKAEVCEADIASVQEIIRSHYPDLDLERHRVVLINANASDLLPQRRWDQSRYAQVARNILEHHEDILILLTGSKGEAEGLAALADEVDHERCINFAGAVGFRQLPALYSTSLLMISNDSGPAHFAAVTDMPTFVLFGPETPSLYGSLGPTTPIYAGLACSPCVSAANHRKTACTNNVCLQMITPEQVVSAVEPLLTSASS